MSTDYIKGPDSLYCQDKGAINWIELSNHQLNISEFLILQINIAYTAWEHRSEVHGCNQSWDHEHE